MPLFKYRTFHVCEGKGKVTAIVNHQTYNEMGCPQNCSLGKLQYIVSFYIMESKIDRISIYENTISFDTKTLPYHLESNMFATKHAARDECERKIKELPPEGLIAFDYKGFTLFKPWLSCFR